MSVNMSQELIYLDTALANRRIPFDIDMDKGILFNIGGADVSVSFGKDYYSDQKKFFITCGHLGEDSIAVKSSDLINSCADAALAICGRVALEQSVASYLENRDKDIAKIKGAYMCSDISQDESVDLGGASLTLPDMGIARGEKHGLYNVSMDLTVEQVIELKDIIRKFARENKKG